MNPDVKIAVEGIYTAFKDVAKPTKIEGCQRCIDGKHVDILLSKPLRSLTAEELSDYAASVFLTVGCLDDFLYFLPRILEILIQEDGWWPNAEVVARSILQGNFQDWPATRQKAVMKYFHEVLKSFLAENNSDYEIDGWVCALGNLHLDLASFLSLIKGNPSRLVEFYEVNSNALIAGRLENQFWGNAPEQERQVVEWFGAAETRKVIDAAYGMAH